MFTDAFIESYQRERTETLRRLVRRRRRAVPHPPPATPRPRREIALDDVQAREPVGARR